VEQYTAIFPTYSSLNLERCVDSLLLNSKNLEEIIVIWDGDHDSYLKISANLNERVKCIENPCPHADVYGMFNYGASIAQSEYILLVNDDMYFPKDWDENMPLDPKSVITFVVVEPGFVKVNEKNIAHSFGFTWSRFKKEKFEGFAKKFPARGLIKENELGWYMPVLFPKSLFFESGAYPNDVPFPNPNDVLFFEKLKKNKEIRFAQVNSPIYHFQRLSQRKNDLLSKFIYSIKFSH
jgi:glycosyltransferase involved in cell wall biosynthesis